MNLTYNYSIVKFNKQSDSEHRKDNQQYGVCAQFLFFKYFVYATGTKSSKYINYAGLNSDGRPSCIMEHELQDAVDLYHYCTEFDTPSAWWQRNITWLRHKLNMSKDFETLTLDDVQAEKAIQELS